MSNRPYIPSKELDDGSPLLRAPTPPERVIADQLHRQALEAIRRTLDPSWFLNDPFPGYSALDRHNNTYVGLISDDEAYDKAMHGRKFGQVSPVEMRNLTGEMK